MLKPVTKPPSRVCVAKNKAHKLENLNQVGVVGPQQSKVVEIFVNGKPRKFEGYDISYEQAVSLAFPEGPFDTIYTATYVSPHGQDGTLAPGQSTTAQEGMELRVRKTNRS